MKHFSLEINRLKYEGDDSGTSCRGDFSGKPALPRRFVSFSGFAFEVCFLKSNGSWKSRMNFSLYSICIPSSIVSIFECCFSSCHSLCLTAFEYGSQLSVIEYSAFAYCSSLKSICIPSGVQTLCVRTFLDCRRLVSVVFALHSRLSRIQAGAFCENSKLESICLPADLERIENGAFEWDCLKYVDIDPENRHFAKSGRFLLDFEGVSIVRYVGIARELCISRDIEELCDSCFSDQRYLCSVSFEPDCRLRRIGAWAFWKASIECIVIPESVEIIGTSCFYACAQLSVVTFEPKSRLCLIEKDAFGSCPALQTVYIPGRLQEIALAGFGFRSGARIVTIEN
jgi:hypothetical protein